MSEGFKSLSTSSSQVGRGRERKRAAGVIFLRDLDSLLSLLTRSECSFLVFYDKRPSPDSRELFERVAVTLGGAISVAFVHLSDGRLPSRTADMREGDCYVRLHRGMTKEQLERDATTVDEEEYLVDKTGICWEGAVDPSEEDLQRFVLKEMASLGLAEGNVLIQSVREKRLVNKAEEFLR